MVVIQTAYKLALAFDEVTESPHHDVAVRAFKVRGKVFATLNEKEERMTVRLLYSTRMYSVPLITRSFTQCLINGAHKAGHT